MHVPGGDKRRPGTDPQARAPGAARVHPGRHEREGTRMSVWKGEKKAILAATSVRAPATPATALAPAAAVTSSAF